MRRRDIESLAQVRDEQQADLERRMKIRVERCENEHNEPLTWVPELHANICKSCVFDAWVDRMTNSRELMQKVHAVIRFALRDYRQGAPSRKRPLEEFARDVTYRVMNYFL